MSGVATQLFWEKQNVLNLEHSLTPHDAIRLQRTEKQCNAHTLQGNSRCVRQDSKFSDECGGIDVYSVNSRPDSPAVQRLHENKVQSVLALKEEC